MIMSKITRTIAFLFIAIVAVSCELGDSPSEEDLKELPNRWIVEKVRIDGMEDNATNYSNFLLSIDSDKTYYLRDIYGMDEEGNWSVGEDSRLLLTPSQGEDKEYIIVSLANDRLILLFKDKYFKETESSFEYTLVPE